ncbi:MAG TPA: NADH-quinone oxidoreductase subunit NuoK [Terriglobales bacterium]|nr:NADH-quinone oxidoreductase subunit NuoK [Terriglobales bacterium]
MTLYHFLSLSALLFCIGIFGVLTRRNAIGILMAIELLFNAVNINFVAFARFINPQGLTGQIFTIFVITVAAAEAAVGLALIILIYRQHKGVEVDKINIMKW